MKIEEVGPAIREARARHGLTQAALGARFNVTRQAICQWESGKSAPPLAIWLELAPMLDIPKGSSAVDFDAINLRAQNERLRKAVDALHDYLRGLALQCEAVAAVWKRT